MGKLCGRSMEVHTSYMEDGGKMGKERCDRKRVWMGEAAGGNPPTAELVLGPTPLSPRLPAAQCTPHPAPGQTFFGSATGQIWDVPWTPFVTGGMEVGVQRSQNPQYYGVWRTVVGQKCPVREVQWAGGVHHQGVRGTGQQQGDRVGVVQGRSREVQGSWRGERRAWPPALYHRLALLLLTGSAHLGQISNFDFAPEILRIPDPRSAAT